MKEYPILFSGKMVKKILEGKKTQTRRILKPQPVKILINKKIWTWKDCRWAGQGPILSFPISPYGKTGDRLWVRETWAAGGDDKSVFAADYAANDKRQGKWRPSIFMPRRACRIVLEIISIRVERLQDISDEDARSEGIPNAAYAINARASFELLWNSINAKRGFGWNTNPWVWVIKFKKIND